MIVDIVSPFPLAKLPALWLWMDKFRSRVFDDLGPQTQQDFVALYASRLDAGMQTWGIRKDGEVGGFVSAEQYPTGIAEVHIVVRPEFFGRKIALPGLRMVLTEVFAYPGCRKVFSLVTDKNNSLLDLASKLGAKVEGRLEKHSMRNGKPVDMLPVGLLKENFQPWDGEQHSAESLPALAQSAER